MSNADTLAARAAAATAERLAELGTADRDALRETVAAMPRDELAAALATPQGGAALAGAVEQMPAHYTGEVVDPPAVARWLVHRPGGEQLAYDVRLGAGTCAVGPVDPVAEPAVTLTLDAVSFLEMATGARSGMDLLMQGRLHVEGDVDLAVRMESLFGLGRPEHG
jgi:hypothetical protein